MKVITITGHGANHDIKDLDEQVNRFLEKSNIKVISMQFFSGVDHSGSNQKYGGMKLFCSILYEDNI